LTQTSDFLVIGSGIAGLSFALRAAKIGTVIILTKKERADTNTNLAQGGIASVFASDDSFNLHIHDTVKAGVNLGHLKAIELIVREGPESIKELEQWGVTFTYQNVGDSHFDLGREGGHSRNRIVHVKDQTGMAIEQALLEKVRDNQNILFFENHTAIELITEHHLLKKEDGQKDSIHCWGVYALDENSGEVKIYLAKATLLATGGVGRVYLHTTNPSIATGDGIAIAFRAGAAISNLEFMQFHPTSLYHPEGESFLISEAVRGFGAVLRTKNGNLFMEKYHPQADLAPRDVVARAIDTEMKRSGHDCVYLHTEHLNAKQLRDRFPQINTKLLSLKIDMTKEPIPVVPAAHYMCGGILTDLNGRSSIEGLYVAGETACTGVHGANRLASNSLLEALVFSRQVYFHASRYIKEQKISLPKIPPWDDEGTFDHEEWVLISHDQRETQRLMWDYVGIVRSTERLQRAGRRIELIQEEIETFYKRTRVTHELLELRNLACVASLIIRSALFRKESRGLHYTTDYPRRDDKNWVGDTVILENKTFLHSLSGSLPH
jgi:L-aspartate oxidase